MKLIWFFVIFIILIVLGVISLTIQIEYFEDKNCVVHKPDKLALKIEEAEFEKQLEKLVNSNNKLQKQYDTMSNQNAELQVKVNNFNKEINNQKNLLVQRQNDINHWKELYQTTSKQIDTCTGKLKTCNNDLEKCNTSMKTLSTSQILKNVTQDSKIKI